MYRLTEAIGRWSMVDIYVITIMVALVRLGNLATIEAAAGAVFFGAVVVLLSALTYWLAGVHHDRAMLAVGALLGAGYAVVVLLPGPMWTLTGVLIGGALAAAGWSARRGRAATA